MTEDLWLFFTEDHPLFYNSFTQLSILVDSGQFLKINLNIDISEAVDVQFLAILVKFGIGLDISEVNLGQLMNLTVIMIQNLYFGCDLPHLFLLLRFYRVFQ